MIWPFSLLFPKARRPRKPLFIPRTSIPQPVRERIRYRHGGVAYVPGGLESESIVEPLIEGAAALLASDDAEETRRHRHREDTSPGYVPPTDLPLEKPHTGCTAHSHDYGSTRHTHCHDHQHGDNHNHSHHSHDSHVDTGPSDCGSGGDGGTTTD